MPALPLPLPTGPIRQTPPAYSAIKVGGRRAYALARAGEEFELPEREVHVDALRAARPRRRPRAPGDRVLGRHLRALAGDDFGDAYCEELRRTAIGDFASRTPMRSGSCRSTTRSRSCPRSGWRATTPGALPRRRGAGPEADGFVRLIDADGLIAIAEPRPDDRLKPIVGFRG